MWTLRFFINSMLLGVGLAMDAFSVSLADGLAEPKMDWGHIAKIAGIFGLFQMAMPLLGWTCVSTLASWFLAIDPWIPWIALVLLVVLGGRMIWEGVKDKPEEEKVYQLSGKVLLLQGVATSIDALSVGFALAHYDALQAFVSALIIGLVTFAICVLGLHLGRKAGTKLSGKAQIFGGIILIGIGLEILFTH